jgi:hypothetical protein
MIKHDGTLALDPIMRKRRLPSLDALPFITKNHRDLDGTARDLVARARRRDLRDTPPP